MAQRKPSMNINHLAAVLASALPISKADALRGTRAIFNELRALALAGERLNVHKFGTFFGVVRKAREGRNPRTGAPIDVPGCTVLGFKRSKGASAPLVVQEKGKRHKKG